MYSRLIFAILLSGLSCTAQSKLPSREDCIVRFTVIWQEDSSQVNSENVRLANIIGMKAKEFGVAGLTVQGEARNIYYLQFKEACDKKLIITQKIIDNWAPDAPVACLLYTSPSPRDVEESRMPSSA